ncbi:MAG: acetoacetate--CoA ligase [bacterium]
MSTQLDDFIHHCHTLYSSSDSVCDFETLYEWSLRHSADFWASLWSFSDLITQHSIVNPYKKSSDVRQATWFCGARLNFAENCLRFRDDQVALYYQSETTPLQQLSYLELYNAVSRWVCVFNELGLTPGDRVAASMTNCPETLIAMLAVTALGGVWSSCSPDFGRQALYDRFSQISPRFFISCDAYQHKGRLFDCRELMQGVAADCGLSDQHLWVSSGLLPQPSRPCLINLASQQDVCRIPFVQCEAEDPLYILFSSGTTGTPKCLVHGIAGTLLQHIKEHRLHCDLRRKDTLFYYSTCAWMMWNWLVSGLATGCSIVLVDGDPFYPDYLRLWHLVDSCQISVFGTSPKYLSTLAAKKVRLPDRLSVRSLRLLLSTGAPLSQHNREYVSDVIKKDLRISSISGGTDIISCFALGRPDNAPHQGALACRGLGMAVDVFDSQGRSLRNQVGELVCTAPFPCMPLGFYNDMDQKRYRASYFDHYPSIWRHGDLATLYSDGSMDIWGRSDATLNPSGVRIGSADIYSALDTLDEVMDAVAVSQRWKDDQRIVLFVELAKGISLSSSLKKTIKTVISQRCSPYHVPKVIAACPGIPYTRNAKKVELAVKQSIHQESVPQKSSLINPDILDFYYAWGAASKGSTKPQ